MYTNFFHNVYRTASWFITCLYAGAAGSVKTVIDRAGHKECFGSGHGWRQPGHFGHFHRLMPELRLKDILERKTNK